MQQAILETSLSVNWLHWYWHP